MIRQIAIWPDADAKCWLAAFHGAGFPSPVPLPFTTAATYAAVRAHLAVRWPGAAVVLTTPPPAPKAASDLPSPDRCPFPGMGRIAR